jgi:hypothetical protein
MRSSRNSSYDDEVSPRAELEEELDEVSRDGLLPRLKYIKGKINIRLQISTFSKVVHKQF